MLVKMCQDRHAKQVQAVAALAGPVAARLASLAYVQLQAIGVAFVVGLIAGIWLERRGPAILWAPMGLAPMALFGLLGTGAVTNRRMNRAASEYVSSILGYEVKVVPNQFVLRRSCWEDAIERAKRVHESEAAGKPQSGTCDPFTAEDPTPLGPNPEDRTNHAAGRSRQAHAL